MLLACQISLVSVVWIKFYEGGGLENTPPSDLQALKKPSPYRVKSQKSYGLLITKELIFGFQILNLKDHFSASLKYFGCTGVLYFQN